ncbi:hypothetical protein I6N96_12755 [Enterococcus sp. BWM-S5]|uniref:Uncharacterized protein n=1 Tax=Enterococcus larvae TaxID=2794352 RepID=A0ABS4CKL7_9ENTE|nr:hypothetical protein [Enterococcus larvae]MBP1047144.1 hypothetical protein [Enterococcus larvae]
MRKTIFLLFLLLSMFSFPLSAAAEDIQNTPNEAQGLKVEKFDLDSYQSYVNNKDSMNPMTDKGQAGWINGAANILFGFNKMFYSAFDFGLEIFSEKNILNQYVDQFTLYSKKIYNNLYSKYITTIVVIVAVYCFYLYVTKGERQAINKFLTFIAIFLVGFVWNEKAGEIIKYADSLASELQADLMTITSEDQSGDDATTKVRNSLFEMTVEEPFYLLNYGVTSKEDINTKEEPNRSEALLVTEATNSKYEELRKVIEGSESDNKFLAPDKAGWKLSIAALSIPMTLLIGIPMFMIQMFNFLLQMIVLLISSVIGISMFLSLVPAFSGAAKNTFKYLFGVVALRAGTGLAFSLLVLIVQLGRVIVPAADAKSYMVQAFTIFFIIYICWKFRNKIIVMVTGGMVASLEGGMWKQTKKVGKDGWDSVKATENAARGARSIPDFFKQRFGRQKEEEELERRRDSSVDPNDLTENNNQSDVPFDINSGNLNTSPKYQEHLENATNDIQDDISSLGTDMRKGFSEMDDPETMYNDMSENGLNQDDYSDLSTAYDYPEYENQNYSINEGMVRDSEGYSAVEFDEPDMNISEYTTNHEQKLHDSYDVDLTNEYGSDLQESQESRIPEGLDQTEYEQYKSQMYGKIVDFPRPKKDEETTAAFYEELAEARGE